MVKLGTLIPILALTRTLNFVRYQEKLRVHSLRVMFVVEKTLNRIDNEENAAKVRTDRDSNWGGRPMTSNLERRKYFLSNRS